MVWALLSRSLLSWKTYVNYVTKAEHSGFDYVTRYVKGYVLRRNKQESEKSPLISGREVKRTSPRLIHIRLYN